MKTLNSIPVSLLSLLLASSLGCDSQTGESYTGEVLLELEGRILLEDDAEAVPTLAFITDGGIALVKGDVEGDVPSDFRFTVTEPPPPEALSQGVALGWLLFAPADAPLRYVRGEFESDYGEQALDREVGDRFSVSERECWPDGACVERQLACVVEACQLVEGSGDRSLLDTPDRVGLLDVPWSNGNEWYLAGQVCTPEDECYREIRRCPDANLDLARGDFRSAYVSGGVIDCTLESERGDLGASQLPSLSRASNKHVVLYSQDGSVPEGFEMPLRDPAALRPGYNLIEYPRDTAPDWMQRTRCLWDAPFTARDEYNAEHGTDFDYGSLEDAPQDAATAIRARSFELARNCRVGSEAPYVLTQEETRRLEISLGKAPTP